jgi:hypothetical protein
LAQDESNLYIPQAASLADLSIVHDMAYLQKPLNYQLSGFFMFVGNA